MANSTGAIMSIHSKLKKTAIALSLALAGTSAALAAPLVTGWGYSVTTNWVTAGPGAPTFDTGNGATFVSPTVLSWGADKGAANNGNTATWATGNSSTARSGLVITPDVPVTNSDLLTNGGSVNTHTITHYNNTILAAFSSLETASVITTLTLTPLLPNPPYGSGALPTLSRTFAVDFIETFNTAGSTACPDTGSVSKCDDIFVLEAADLVQNFSFLGNFYTLTIGAPGLGPLGSVACGLAGAGADCVGFRTQELQNTPVTFNFRIAGREGSVPEPGVLGLLGLGLAAVGLRARRRQS
jgi:hypothetical protein